MWFILEKVFKFVIVALYGKKWKGPEMLLQIVLKMRNGAERPFNP